MFKIGQKIVCVKVNPLGTLKEGEIYTVIDIRASTGGVKLKEQEATDPYSSGYFSKHRFRSVDDSWVEELLQKLIKEVKADEFMPA